MPSRTCKKCLLEKDITAFGKHRRKKDGIDTHCKLCKYVALEKWKKLNEIKVKEIKSKCDKEWYKAHKNKKLKTNQDWKTNNSARNKEWYRRYKREHKMVDPAFKLINKMRTRLWYAIKKKRTSTIRLIGCTAQELRGYLESKWQLGMTWDNYGRKGWHIDHIVPLSSFNLDKPEELAAACHYTNLQPLWATDNLSKGNKLLT